MIRPTARAEEPLFLSSTGFAIAIFLFGETVIDLLLNLIPGDGKRWVSYQSSIDTLTNGAVNTVTIAPLLTALSLWIILPTIVGTRRYVTREVA